MDLQTTVRNFVNDITSHHISFDTRIRVIIDESQMQREIVPDEMFSVPFITPHEQRQRLKDIPSDYDPHASDELIAIIEASHFNTEPIEL